MHIFCLDASAAAAGAVSEGRRDYKKGFTMEEGGRKSFSFFATFARGEREEDERLLNSPQFS